jgi:ethanolamine utilization protein EutQ
MTPAPQASASVGPGVQLIDHQRLLEGENGLIPVDEKMLVAQAIGSDGDEKLAGGFMVWEKASFTRHVEQPEIAVVLEGELHLDAGGKTLKGRPGDMVYFPKGAVVVYSAPARVKLACVNCF